MNSAYASNAVILIWTSVGFLLIAMLLWVIVSRWNVATGTDLSLKTKTAKEELKGLKEAKDKVVKADAEEMEARRMVKVGKDSIELKEALKIVQTKAQEATAQRNLFEITEQKFINAATAEMESSGAKEDVVLLMVILLGALGGSLHFIGSLVKYVGNRQFKRSWLLHYLAMPFTGAALAPIVYMLLRIGFVNPTGVSSDGAGIANLNLIAIYAFSALSGLFAKTATEKLGEVFSTLFRTGGTISKDALGKEKPAGGVTQTG